MNKTLIMIKIIQIKIIKMKIMNWINKLKNKIKTVYQKLMSFNQYRILIQIITLKSIQIKPKITIH